MHFFLLAQSFPTTLPVPPQTWFDFVAKLISLIAGLTALFIAIKALLQGGTNRDNIQTLAATTTSTIDAVNAAPNAPSIPIVMRDEAKKIADDPTTSNPNEVKPQAPLR